MKGVEDGFNCSENFNSSLWREYYLDELFEVDSSLPEWYVNNKEYIIHFKNKTDILPKKEFFETSMNLDTIPSCAGSYI